MMLSMVGHKRLIEIYGVWVNFHVILSYLSKKCYMIIKRKGWPFEGLNNFSYLFDHFKVKFGSLFVFIIPFLANSHN